MTASAPAEGRRTEASPAVVSPAEEVAALVAALTRLAAVRSPGPQARGASGYECWRRTRLAALAQRTAAGTAQRLSAGTMAHIAR